MRATVLLWCAGLCFSLRLDLAPSLGKEKGNAAASNLYLRIQKTGSTSYGRALKELFKAHNQSIAVNKHYDWQSVLNLKLPPSQVFTILRDPVERYLSEIMYIKSSPRGMLCQNMWDFAGHIYSDGERVEALRAINQHPRTNDHLLRRWMNMTLPTRNRQLLYLLGFERIPCPGRKKHDFCIPEGEATRLNAPLPSHAYDYDRDEENILEKAKEHLSSMHFGFTECMSASMRAIASDLGWDPNEAAQFVEVAKLNNLDYNEGTTTSVRTLGRMEADADVMQADESEELMDALDYDSLVDSVNPLMDEQLYGSSDKPSPTMGHTTHASMFDPALIEQLRKHLHAEIVFYNWALEAFNSRYPNEQCKAQKSMISLS